MTRGGYTPCINPDDLGDIILRNRTIQVPGSGARSGFWRFEVNKLTIAHFLPFWSTSSHFARPMICEMGDAQPHASYKGNPSDSMYIRIHSFYIRSCRYFVRQYEVS